MTQVFATLISAVDLFSESLSFQKDDSLNPLLQARWRSLWGNFDVVHFHQPIPKETSKTQEEENSEDPAKKLENWVDQECQWTPVLSRLGSTYLASAPNHTKTLETPHMETTSCECILQLARPYYEKIWETLTLNEQLALYHLARDRFIHIGHPGLEPLFRKELIRFDPDLRIINTTLREFVLQAGDRDQLAHQEATQGKSLWDSMKVPVGLGFTIVVGTLILTQEELRTALPAVFAALPFLFQGLSDFNKAKKSTA